MRSAAYVASLRISSRAWNRRRDRHWARCRVGRFDGTPWIPGVTISPSAGQAADGPAASGPAAAAPSNSIERGGLSVPSARRWERHDYRESLADRVESAAS